MSVVELKRLRGNLSILLCYYEIPIKTYEQVQLRMIGVGNNLKELKDFLKLIPFSKQETLA